jgi:capsular exopolysaccharide synthesis family protein
LNPGGLVNKTFDYAEIHRIREGIVGELQKENLKTVMVAGPHDDAGITFLVSVLGYNIARFSAMRVLLVDLNMRRPQLHLSFGLDIGKGFSAVASGLLPWRDALRDTTLKGLQIMTAGRVDTDLSPFLTRSLLDTLIREMKEEFDLILFDTSPLLVQNRSNVDPALLSLVCDMVVLVVQDKRTTKSELQNAIAAIPQGGRKIRGIVYNHQF